MDLDEAVDELYALAPGEFTARRDALAAQAKKDGDAGLAKQLKTLRRPTAGAYAVNQLAREAADDLSDYLELGQRLRDAQAGLKGDQLRSLGQERQQAASALVETAAGLADGGLSDAARQEVDATLRAAVADPAASEAVASGRLTKALAYAGFGEVDLTAATATPLSGRARATAPATAPAEASAEPPAEPPAKAPPAKPPAKARPETRGADRVLAQRREQAARELDDAERALREARQAAEAATAADEQAERAHADAEQQVSDLRDALAQARLALRDAQRRAVAASSGRSAADKALATAQKAAARARDRVTHLSERSAP